jgi:hypothetical protein
MGSGALTSSPKRASYDSIRKKSRRSELPATLKSPRSSAITHSPRPTVMSGKLSPLHSQTTRHPGYDEKTNPSFIVGENVKSK